MMQETITFEVKTVITEKVTVKRLDRPIKVYSLTLEREKNPWGGYWYNVLINGEETGLPESAEEAKESFDYFYNLITEHGGYYSPSWLA